MTLLFAAPALFCYRLPAWSGHASEQAPLPLWDIKLLQASLTVTLHQCKLGLEKSSCDGVRLNRPVLLPVLMTPTERRRFFARNTI
jgi:hypothetical protein